MLQEVKIFKSNVTCLNRGLLNLIWWDKFSLQCNYGILSMMHGATWCDIILQFAKIYILRGEDTYNPDDVNILRYVTLRGFVNKI